MISEYRALQMIDNPSDAEKERMAVLLHEKRVVRKRVKNVQPPAPPISEQLDKIKELCGGKNDERGK